MFSCVFSLLGFLRFCFSIFFPFPPKKEEILRKTLRSVCPHKRQKRRTCRRHASLLLISLLSFVFVVVSEKHESAKQTTRREGVRERERGTRVFPRASWRKVARREEDRKRIHSCASDHREFFCVEYFPNWTKALLLKKRRICVCTRPETERLSDTRARREKEKERKGTTELSTTTSWLRRR